MFRNDSASASSLHASQPPMLASGSFLALIVIPSASEAISRTMSATSRAGLALLALADEPGVLGEAAGVQEKRYLMLVADGPHLVQVRQADRLATCRVVGDRDHHHGHVLAPASCDQIVERGGVEVALERMQACRVASLGDDEIDRLGTGELHVGPCRVEMGVVGHDLSGAPDHREEDPLRGAALVRGYHVAEREQLGDGLEEDEPGGRAGVGLVAVLDGRPLVPAHRAGARVGEQVDEHVARREVEDVVAGVAYRRRRALRGLSSGAARPRGCGTAR